VEFAILDWEADVFAKFSVVAVMALSIISTQSALAQKTDLTSLKCAEFLGMAEPNTLNIVTWLQGYYTYEDDPVVVDNDKAKSKEAQIKEYCTDHKDTDLVSVSAIFMDKKYNAGPSASPTNAHQ
jgi:HdeA/HdeB family